MKGSVLSTIAAGLLIGVAGASFGQENDIVVTGRPDILKTGLWEITKTAPRVRGGTPNGQQDRKWSVCLSDGNGKAALQKMLTDLYRPEGLMSCSGLRLSVKNQKISGARSCNTLGVEWKYVYSGRMQQTILKIVETTSAEVRSGATSEGMSQIHASFMGECQGATTQAGETPANDKSISVNKNADLSAATERLKNNPPNSLRNQAGPSPQSDVQIVSTHPFQAPEAGADASEKLKSDRTPVADERPNDIVVTARKFRNLRLAFNSFGRQMRHCEVVRSSGSKKFDRAGCSVLRQCVAEGSVSAVEALPCVNRRMNILFPPTESEMEARLAH